ncbi:hypothetical protein PIB30_081981 [Stylosanthes scabra]|uniref:Uncharacterized protein n=1 Tax=Stylosanthes scabra TaxID=79078 RepID=A0ABU6YTN6_9FABA|nr:hypothetical protein [Stylosanthes scabra]
MMGANKNEIDQLVSKVGEQQHQYTEAMRHLKEWTRNASIRECYVVWAHQQTNPNLIEMPVHKEKWTRKLENHGKQSKRPCPGASSSRLGVGHQVSTLPVTFKHPSSHAQARPVPMPRRVSQQNSASRIKPITPRRHAPTPRRGKIFSTSNSSTKAMPRRGTLSTGVSQPV